MKYEITAQFRATDKEFEVGDVVSKEDLGSSFGIAFSNNWIKAVAEPVSEEPKRFLKVKAND